MLCSAQNPKLNKQFASGFLPWLRCFPFFCAMSFSLCGEKIFFARFRAPDTQKYHYRREPRCC